MHIRGLAVALALAPVLLLGQLGTGTVTVTASNNSNPQPDQAIFSVSVESAVTQSLEGVVTALTPAGISAANLTGLNLQSATGSQKQALSWFFQLTVPLSQIKNTAASLLSLQKTIGQNGSGLTLSFSVQGTQVSSQLMQNCDFTGLMANARTEAQNIAAASGFTSGAVVGLTGSVSQSIPGCSLTATFGLPVARSGPNTITVTASQTATPVPDQVQIQMYVTSTTSVGLDDVNAALAAAGITGATFIGINNGVIASVLPGVSPFSTAPIQWVYSLAVPLAKLSSTLAQLSTAQQAISKQNSALSLSFNLYGLQTSSQAQPVCTETSLLSDARKQAQTLATAAGVGLGAILNTSDQTLPVPDYIFDPYAVAGFGYASFLLGVQAPTGSACSLSVQFQLL
jgi:uncharacterized protein YggE